MQQKAPRKRGFLFGRGKGTPPWPSPSLREREGKEQLQLQLRWSGPRCFMWVRPNKIPAFAGISVLRRSSFHLTKSGLRSLLALRRQPWSATGPV